MENSVHHTRAELDASANATQSCLICKNLKPERQDYESNNINIKSLRDDCGYCRILKSTSEFLVNGHPTNLLVRYKEGEPCSVKYFFEPEQDPDHRYTNRAEFIVYSHEKSQLIPELGILSPYLESTDLGASVDFINKQVSECRTQHETCRKHLESPLPTRVLSIGSSDADIRLVELKNVPAQYVTLSHCWGHKQPVRTLTSNFEEMKKSIDANALPMVFQQAIWIARMLKIEYVWIDSLCIIQDSQSDWELESVQMCDYYENSFLTISMATSSDSSIPFLGPRDERWLPIKLELTDGLSSENVYAQRIAIKPEEEGKLFTRAWAWQEAAMSSRTIYFTPSELIWECPKHVVPQRYIPDRDASDRMGFSSVLSMLRFLNPYIHRDINSPVRDSGDESPSGGDYLMNIPSPGSESGILSEALPLSRPDSPCSSSNSSDTNMMDYVWDMWDDLVTYYSRRQITFVTDRLPALSGVASRVHKITKSRYLAGMWEDSLGIELCWVREHRGYRDLMTLPAAYVAPSWSWASIPGGVTNQVERTISIFEPQATIIEAYSEVPGLNLFGKVTAGHLVMRGQVAEATLTCDDPHTSLSYKTSGPADEWEFFPDSILVSNNGNVARAKQDQKSSDFRAKIFCLYVGLRKDDLFGGESGREHLMLVLGHSEDVDAGSPYCRVGLACSKSDSLFKEAPTLDVKLV